jgi:hypothetical protein
MYWCYGDDYVTNDEDLMLATRVTQYTAIGSINSCDWTDLVNRVARSCARRYRERVDDMVSECWYGMVVAWKHVGCVDLEHYIRYCVRTMMGYCKEYALRGVATQVPDSVLLGMADESVPVIDYDISNCTAADSDMIELLLCGFTCADIARILDLSRSAVSQRISVLRGKVVVL